MTEDEEEGYQNPLLDMIEMKLNPDEIIKNSLKRSINMNKGYVERCQQNINNMEESDEPKDRIAAAVELETIIKYMDVSIDGWLQWCTLRSMNIISDKEFKEILPKMKKLAIKWIEIDKKITIIKTKEMEEELKELEVKTSKITQKKESKPYIG